jgi:hypothetical protein
MIPSGVSKLALLALLSSILIVIKTIHEKKELHQNRKQIEQIFF